MAQKPTSPHALLLLHIYLAQRANGEQAGKNDCGTHSTKKLLVFHCVAHAREIIKQNRWKIRKKTGIRISIEYFPLEETPLRKEENLLRARL